jgi:hypothetical protein
VARRSRAVAAAPAATEASSARAPPRRALVARRRGLGRLRLERHAQARELFGAGRDRFGERLALATPVLDAPLGVLDLAAQREQLLAAQAHRALALGELDAPHRGLAVALGEPRLERGALSLEARAPAAGLLGRDPERAAVVHRERELDHA